MTATSNSRSLTKEELSHEFGGDKPLALNTVRQTIVASGLDTTKRIYSPEEVLVFKAARQMIEGGSTYQQVSEHFKVDLNSANDGGEAFFENQAAEATASGEIPFQLANAIAEGMAEQVVGMVPGLTMYHLNKLLGGESLNRDLRKMEGTIRSYQRGNPHALMLQGIEKMETGAALPPSSPKSSVRLTGKAKDGATETTSLTTAPTQPSSTTSTGLSSPKSNNDVKT